MVVGKSESGVMGVVSVVVVVGSLPSVRAARGEVWVLVSGENWTRSSARSASVCSSRVSFLGVFAMSGAEMGGSGVGAENGVSLCGGDWIGSSSAAPWDELHHHPMLLIDVGSVLLDLDVFFDVL